MSDTMMMQFKSLHDEEWTDYVAARCAFCGDTGRVHLKPKLPVPTVVRCSGCGQWFHRGCLSGHVCPGVKRLDMDKQETVNETLPLLQRVVEDPLCREFLAWVDSQGERETWLDISCFKLCLACLLEGEWSLEKAKQFAKGESS